MTSRTLAAAALTVAMAGSLSACGGSDNKNAAAQASVQACRSYVLLGGADDKRIATELQQAVDGAGGFNIEDIQSRLAAVRAGATKAGLVADLPKKDYRLFAAVVEQTITLSSNVQSDDAALKQAILTAYDEAVAAVAKVCD